MITISSLGLARSVRTALVAMAALLVGAGLLVAVAPAAEASQWYTPIIKRELERRPGGIVKDNTITYRDGTVFVAVRAHEVSVDQCKSGRFCGWQSANYRGSFYYVTGSGVTKSLRWSARSYRNHRTTAARLYASDGTTSTCMPAKRKIASASSPYHKPSKVKLSATSSC